MLAKLMDRLSDLRSIDVQIGHIRPSWSDKQLNSGIVNRVLHTVTVNDQDYIVTPRFLQSLAARFHIGREFFRYYTPSEVFQRVQIVHPRHHVRLTVDGEYALGMSNPARPYVTPPEMCKLLDDQGENLVDVEYGEGVVTTTHKLDEADCKIGGEVFKHTYTFEIPMDGFGLPSVYLSMIRQICTNGMIGYAPAFRTDISLGKDKSDGIVGPLGRAMDCFSNEEGYAAIRERLESARRSEASVYEVRLLARAITRDSIPRKRFEMQKLYDKLWRLSGDLSVKYGVASDEAISPKKQRMLPMDCTIYDLITFATEVTSHHGDKLQSGRQIHAWVGQTLAAEYDLEGSLAKDKDACNEPVPAFYLN